MNGHGADDNRPNNVLSFAGASRKWERDIRASQRSYRETNNDRLAELVANWAENGVPKCIQKELVLFYVAEGNLDVLKPVADDLQSAVDLAIEFYIAYCALPPVFQDVDLAALLAAEAKGDAEFDAAIKQLQGGNS